VNLTGFAKRLRSSAELQPEINRMEIVVCDKCGQRFAICHVPVVQSIELTGKQAAWVADHLVWDHIQERKHHARIELPVF